MHHPLQAPRARRPVSDHLRDAHMDFSESDDEVPRAPSANPSEDDDVLDAIPPPPGLIRLPFARPEPLREDMSVAEFFKRDAIARRRMAHDALPAVPADCGQFQLQDRLEPGPPVICATSKGRVVVSKARDANRWRLHVRRGDLATYGRLENVAVPETVWPSPQDDGLPDAGRFVGYEGRTRREALEVKAPPPSLTDVLNDDQLLAAFGIVPTPGIYPVVDVQSVDSAITVGDETWYTVTWKPDAPTGRPSMVRRTDMRGAEALFDRFDYITQNAPPRASRRACSVTGETRVSGDQREVEVALAGGTTWWFPEASVRNETCEVQERGLFPENWF